MAAKEITGGEVPEKRAEPPQPQKKEQRSEAPAPAPKAPRLTEEQIQRKATATLEEYLNVNDMAVSSLCFKFKNETKILRMITDLTRNETDKPRPPRLARL